MSNEQARDFCRKRGAFIEEWTGKEDQQPRFGVSYWYWYAKGKEEARIHQVAGSLVEVVELCQAEEERIREGRPKQPKEENSSLKDAIDTTSWSGVFGVKYCPGCSSPVSIQATQCHSCGYSFP